MPKTTTQGGSAQRNGSTGLGFPGPGAQGRVDTTCAFVSLALGLLGTICSMRGISRTSEAPLARHAVPVPRLIMGDGLKETADEWAT